MIQESLPPVIYFYKNALTTHGNRSIMKNNLKIQVKEKRHEGFKNELKCILLL